ncbi:LysR family transcriptional regulator [Staphylococcus simiae]|uniref:LysR family transcriptional regulator n=1 Tax=Staphylococcus simiae TaxID=308354 RepID=UPI001A956B61|nr:LysR family transcriptional regulator [Staphylococcus simiae]MBO1198644.1 LysR family transcriptional regulator [Staphylococcus simiae]MBO1200871.1 LysR family transcriptional regulator [Staphylococcus simiae]MBO1203079.1 LysR family transcriptional regulator [Staphylococcus simiae]MBO1211750.1 LysR family transcriptional regulator [Staphylococcus simiae]MBO1229207.1 LysR family transcriptional regulator [Staphylococcus simiae]
MKIIQLEYFLAIVKYNSFTKASQFLHISQPSLTATIKKMEADLGYDLFIRSTKDIKITEKGIQFYHYAKDLVHQYRSTMEKMYDLNVSTVPRIKVGALESTNQWLSQLIRKHHVDFPHQQYRLYEIHDKSRSIEELLNFNIHIALTNETINHDDIESVALYDESYILLAPKETFCHQDWVNVQNLPLILPNKNSQVRKHLDDYFNRSNVRPNIIVETDRFESAVSFVHLGLGYAIIPRFYYQSFNTDHLEYKKIRPNLGRTIYINYLKKRNHSTEVNNLIQQCKDYWLELVQF